MITLGHYIIYILIACGQPHYTMVMDPDGKMWANDSEESRKIMHEARTRNDTEMRAFEAIVECKEQHVI